MLLCSKSTESENLSLSSKLMRRNKNTCGYNLAILVKSLNQHGANRYGSMLIQRFDLNRNIVAVSIFLNTAILQKKKLRFDPTWGSYNSGLKNYRITNNHIFGIARTSAFIWHPQIPLEKFCKRTRRVCVCIVLVHFGRYSQEVNEKSVKLAVWAVSSNFLHDFTLFVVDIHQIRLISLFRHFPDHFHFHGSAGLIPKVNLSLRPTVKIFTLEFSLKFCWGFSIHVDRPGKNSGPKSQC